MKISGSAHARYNEVELYFRLFLSLALPQVHVCTIWRHVIDYKLESYGFNVIHLSDNIDIKSKSISETNRYKFNLKYIAGCQ